jgi:hemoglobin
MADLDEAAVGLGPALAHVSNRYLVGGMLASSAEAGLACGRSARGGFRKIEKMLDENEVYRRIGEDGFTRLVAAFFRRVPQDDILSAMYPQDDLEGAERRLRDFLVFRFGGPQRYIEQRGHPRLRMRHSPFAVDQAARDRWMRLMAEALEEAALPADATETLRSFLDSTATFMINRQ